ncbi:MAG: hypothetical protein ACD_45C00472G0002 [uncultured bacterium]|nr:MAG: hypothetical protein ACD_45C00472G0002 [uncultured bacterium]
MNILFIIIAFALVLLNAFFVAAEFGMVKLRYTRIVTIKKIYGFRGKMLASIHKHLDTYLSACQLGITLASLGLGWIGEPAFADLLRPFLQLLHITSPKWIEIIAFTMAFSFISFLHIVVGELMPKSLAIRQPESVSIWTAVPLYGFYWLMYPAIWLLNNCAIFLLRKTGFDTVHQGDSFYSTDEIKLILSTSYLHGELSKEETKILEHTLDFAELKVTDVMRPREEMIMLRIDQPIDEILQIITEHRYSRYPVYDPKTKEMIGIVHVKNIFITLHQQKKLDNLHSLLRPILKVSHQLPALELLRKFQAGMPHFALIYRGSELLGFTTLDNLLHILIGRVRDEFHPTQEDWRVNPDGSLTVRGNCPLFSIERALGRDIEINPEEAETITGLILNQLGKLPKEGDIIDFNTFKAVIEKMHGHRIIKITIYPKQDSQKE